MVAPTLSVRQLRGRHAGATVAGVAGPDPVVVHFGDPAALAVPVVGRKAANLARAAGRGLPVLPGFVLTTTGASLWSAGGRHGRLEAVLHAAWGRISADGTRAVVVRSSSPGEDGETSSMAGRFTSVLDVSGWSCFLEAVDAVIESARTVPPAGHGDGGGALAGPSRMAVLVQPQLAAAAGGVLFGADPVSGRTDRLVVAAVAGGPDRLVSGAALGTRYTLSRHGRVLEVAGEAPPAPPLGLRSRRRLARLAARVAHVFDGPQDVEWAVDGDGRLWLLQSRPVTAIAMPGSGPLLGPGPVSETFPDPLGVLERDLWLEPLGRALGHTVVLTGGASPRRVRRSPVIVSVGGRAAVDLELLGAAGPGHGLAQRLDPRPPARRLRAAWRTGRLRSALPALARDLLATADRELSSVGDVRALTTGEALGLLAGCRRALLALHGQEILLGMLLRPGAGGNTAGGEALKALAAGRDNGLADDDVVARHPVVLALVPPAIGGVHLPEAPLPAPPAAAGGSGEADDIADLREALRLRARWVQELSARTCRELGRRLTDAGLLSRWELVGGLTLAELEALAAGAPAPADLAERVAAAPGPPLPARFRLAADGTVVTARDPSQRSGQGQGAGGGRGGGPVARAGSSPVPPGSVLVVGTLSPALAAQLPGLGGLVAESGSVLSHLAILARELGVPTVVGVAGALERFPPGTVVVVDGTTGEVGRLPGPPGG